MGIYPLGEQKDTSHWWLWVTSTSNCSFVKSFVHELIISEESWGKPSIHLGSGTPLFIWISIMSQFKFKYLTSCLYISVSGDICSACVWGFSIWSNIIDVLDSSSHKSVWPLDCWLRSFVHIEGSHFLSFKRRKVIVEAWISSQVVQFAENLHRHLRVVVLINFWNIFVSWISLFKSEWSTLSRLWRGSLSFNNRGLPWSNLVDLLSVGNTTYISIRRVTSASNSSVSPCFIEDIVSM